MALGFFLRVGDKTTCGGQILTGDQTMQWYGVAGAREGDLVSYGKHSGAYHIIGGVNSMWLEDRKHAGSLESFSSCPCHSKFIPSIPDCYSNDDEPAQAKSFSVANEIIDPVKEITKTAPQQEASPFILPVQKVCRYCHRPITLSNACQPEFQDIIREFIDAENDINGVFKELCDYYLKHFDIWKTTYIDNIFSDLHEVVGKNFKTLSSEDKKRFWLLHDQQNKTLFYGDKYSDGNPTDPGYDKVQHIIAGLWLGSNYTYASGVMTAWSVEKIDTYKAVFGELTGTRQRHHIGFDWYDNAFTVAGSALGHLLKNVDDDRCLKALTKFATGQVRFDSFYIPPKLDYLGMGKIDPIFPVSGGNAEKIDNSLDMIFKEF